MSKNNLVKYHGVFVEDNNGLSNLDDVISELKEFISQFSTHAMSDHVLYLKGKEEAYKDVIAYLERITPINTVS